MPGRVQRECPGCGLRMLKSDKVSYDGEYHSSPECYVIFEEVMAGASGDPAYASVRQMMLDAYAAQHASGRLAERTLILHLAGLHAAIDLEQQPDAVLMTLKRLNSRVTRWPRLQVPAIPAPLTVLELAVSEGGEEGVTRAVTWAQSVWNSWSEQHEFVSRLVREYGV